MSAAKDDVNLSLIPDFTVETSLSGNTPNNAITLDRSIDATGVPLERRVWSEYLFYVLCKSTEIDGLGANIPQGGSNMSDNMPIDPSSDEHKRYYALKKQIKELSEEKSVDDNELKANMAGFMKFLYDNRNNANANTYSVANTVDGVTTTSEIQYIVKFIGRALATTFGNNSSTQRVKHIVTDLVEYSPTLWLVGQARAQDSEMQQMLDIGDQYGPLTTTTTSGVSLEDRNRLIQVDKALLDVASQLVLRGITIGDVDDDLYTGDNRTVDDKWKKSLMAWIVSLEIDDDGKLINNMVDRNEKPAGFTSDQYQLALKYIGHQLREIVHIRSVVTGTSNSYTRVQRVVEAHLFYTMNEEGDFVELAWNDEGDAAPKM
jgi:hypothetical protein